MMQGPQHGNVPASPAGFQVGPPAAPSPLPSEPPPIRLWLYATLANLSLAMYGAATGGLAALFRDGGLDRSVGTTREGGRVGTFEGLSFQLESIALWTPLVMLLVAVQTLLLWLMWRPSSQLGALAASGLPGERLAARLRKSAYTLPMIGLVFAYAVGRPGVLGVLGYCFCLSLALGAARLFRAKRA